MKRRLTLGLSLLIGSFCGLSSPGARAQAAPASDELAPLAQAIAAAPNDPAGYDAFAQAAFRSRRWDDAIAQLKAGVGRIPTYQRWNA